MDGKQPERLGIHLLFSGLVPLQFSGEIFFFSSLLFPSSPSFQYHSLCFLYNKSRHLLSFTFVKKFINNNIRYVPFLRVIFSNTNKPSIHPAKMMFAQTHLLVLVGLGALMTPALAADTTTVCIFFFLS